MLDNFQNMYFSTDSFNISYVHNLWFLQDFHSNSGLSKNMHTNLDFSESTLTNGLA